MQIGHEIKNTRTRIMSGERFYHWSKAPVTLVPVCYLQRADYKPRGFWFDVDGDWKEWCERSEWNVDGLEVCHEVHLLNASRVLRMRRSEELVGFTREFSAELYPGQKRGLAWIQNCGIDWPRVAKQYDGIVIAPYVWSCRLSLMWYYGFDCASGCVWNTEILRLVVQPESATVSGNEAPAGRQKKKTP